MAKGFNSHDAVLLSLAVLLNVDGKLTGPQANKYNYTVNASPKHINNLKKSVAPEIQPQLDKLVTALKEGSKLEYRSEDTLKNIKDYLFKIAKNKTENSMIIKHLASDTGLASSVSTMLGIDGSSLKPNTLEYVTIRVPLRPEKKFSSEAAKALYNAMSAFSGGLYSSPSRKLISEKRNLESINDGKKFLLTDEELRLLDDDQKEINLIKEKISDKKKQLIDKTLNNDYNYTYEQFKLLRQETKRQKERSKLENEFVKEDLSKFEIVHQFNLLSRHLSGSQAELKTNQTDKQRIKEFEDLSEENKKSYYSRLEKKYLNL